MRRLAIVDAARTIFFEFGFGGASMNAIAARIGGSKTTLWAYFATKDLLFEAVVDDLVERYGSVIEGVALDSADVAGTLRHFGLAVLETVTSTEVMALHRLVVAEAERFPALGLSYFRKGPGRALERLARFFADVARGGLLAVEDPDRAAAYFLAMCETGGAQSLLLGLEAPLAPQRLGKDVDEAVRTFCRAFAKRG